MDSEIYIQVSPLTRAVFKAIYPANPKQHSLNILYSKEGGALRLNFIGDKLRDFAGASCFLWYEEEWEFTGPQIWCPDDESFLDNLPLIHRLVRKATL